MASQAIQATGATLTAGGTVTSVSAAIASEAKWLGYTSDDITLIIGIIGVLTSLLGLIIMSVFRWLDFRESRRHNLAIEELKRPKAEKPS